MITVHHYLTAGGPAAIFLPESDELPWTMNPLCFRLRTGEPALRTVTHVTPDFYRALLPFSIFKLHIAMTGDDRGYARYGGTSFEAGVIFAHHKLESHAYTRLAVRGTNSADIEFVLFGEDERGIWCIDHDGEVLSGLRGVQNHKGVQVISYETAAGRLQWFRYDKLFDYATRRVFNQ
jgi:hypothetical protein